MSLATVTAESISAESYGAATAAIRSIIRQGSEMRWFEKPAPSDVNRATSIAKMHLRALRDGSTDTWSSLAVEVVSGDWNSLAGYFVAANEVSSTDMYRRGRWRTLLARMTLTAERRLALPDHADLLRPPLFPERRPTILGGMLTNAEAASRRIPQSCKDVLWSLMCDVDRDFWSAVLWLLADCEEPNPFLPLLDLYDLMVYPLGLVDDRFMLVYRET